MTNLTASPISPISPISPASSHAQGDPRAIFARASRLAGDTIAAVRPDQLDLPTPCDGFTTRELVGHLLTVLTRVAVLAEGGDPMAMPGVTVVPDDEIVAAWRSASERVDLAWADDETLDRTMSLPWATVPGRAMLATYTNEVTVHTWDLAQGIGARPAWDDDVVAVSFAAIQVAMPAVGRRERFEAAVANMPAGMAPLNPPFGEAVDVDSAAPLIDRLVGWNGRTPVSN